MSRIRQGDVLIWPVKKLPEAINPVEPENGRLILARGEATGHHHSFAHDRGATFFREDGTGGGAFLRVSTPVPLEHQEHSAIMVAPGAHEVIIQVQWSDADEPIQVSD